MASGLASPPDQVRLRLIDFKPTRLRTRSLSVTLRQVASPNHGHRKTLETTCSWVSTEIRFSRSEHRTGHRRMPLDTPFSVVLRFLGRGRGPPLSRSDAQAHTLVIG